MRKIQQVLQSQIHLGSVAWSWILLSHFHGFLQGLELLRIDLCTCTANPSEYCCGFSGFSFIISKPDALISDEEVVGEEGVNLTVFSGI